MDSVTCPYCKSWVIPTRNELGKLLCPTCKNGGRVAKPAPAFGQGTSPAYQAYVPSTNAPGAAPSLVLGILAVVVPYIGWILGIIALMQSSKARKAIAMDPSLQGKGMATAGKVLGIVSLVWLIIIVVVLVMAIVVVQ
jgi:hypothetical protein